MPRNPGLCDATPLVLGERRPERRRRGISVESNPETKSAPEGRHRLIRDAAPTGLKNLMAGRGYKDGAPLELADSRILKGFHRIAQRCDAEALRWVQGAKNSATLKELYRWFRHARIDW